MKTQHSENTTKQNLWDTVKALLTGKFISAYIKKQRTTSNDQMMHLKELEKQEQTKSKISRRKEIIRIRIEIKEIEMKKIQKMNET